MYNEQDFLRAQVKQAKWQRDISYKESAQACGLAYSSFINWLHDSSIKLSVKRRYLLKKFLGL